MKNLILRGRISATSADEGSIYKNKTKTAYIDLKDEEEYKKAEDFGLTVYTSEDNNKFIIVKLVQKFKGYLDGQALDLSSLAKLDTSNFMTDWVDLNLIKAKHSETKNTFYRLQAINLASNQDIRKVLGSNPFMED